MAIPENIRLTGKSLANALAKGDLKAAKKWADRLSALLTPQKPPVVLVPAAPVAPVKAPVETPPNFGVRKEMSSGLYNDWVVAWMQRTFPEAYRNWPPMVYAVDPSAIAAAAERDGCFAQVCAAGTLGFPGGPYLGDWSLFTALTSTSTDQDGLFLHRVWHMGEMVGEKIGGPNDGMEFAHSLGFNW